MTGAWKLVVSPTGREEVYRVRGVLAHTFSRGPPTDPERPPGGPGTACAVGYFAAGSTCFAAIARAVSESGPGCGTKTASR